MARVCPVRGGGRAPPKPWAGDGLGLATFPWNSARFWGADSRRPATAPGHSGAGRGQAGQESQNVHTKGAPAAASARLDSGHGSTDQSGVALVLRQGAKRGAARHVEV